MVAICSAMDHFTFGAALPWVHLCCTSATHITAAKIKVPFTRCLLRFHEHAYLKAHDIAMT